MPKRPLAVATMVYDEPDFLPVWAAYYGRAVGLENCYVIDHGSNEPRGLLAELPHVRRLPRSPLDEGWRCAIVSQFCNVLMGDYEHVAYTDVDEILLPDPARAPDLPALCETGTPEAMTAFGMDVLHVEGEAAIDFARPISLQRRWVRPFSSLCKPTLVRCPVRWEAGFHYANMPSNFGGLYLFHLAFADFGLLERRQRKREAVPRMEGHALHHAIPTDELVRHVRADYAGLPRHRGAALGAAPERDFAAGLLRDGKLLKGNWVIASDRHTPELWEIPRPLRGRF